MKSRKIALFNDTRPDGHFGCTLVIQQIAALLREQNIEVAWCWPVGRDWHGQIDWRRASAELDGVVVNGEGTIHRTAERDRARWLTELAPFVARETQLPIFLINASIHELDPDSAANLRAYTAIWVRDRLSQANLRRHGVLSNVVPDLSTSADLPGGSRRAGVCVTDSVLPEVTGELRRASWSRGWTWRPLRFAKKGKLRLKSAFADLPWFLVNRYRPHDLPRRFAAFTAKHRLVVTGRYHMVAYCLATRTPFVAIPSNTPKIGALLDDALGSRRRLVRPHEVEDIAESAFDRFTAAESEAVDAFLTKGRNDTAAMFRRIRETIDCQGLMSSAAQERTLQQGARQNAASQALMPAP